MPRAPRRLRWWRISRWRCRSSITLALRSVGRACLGPGHEGRHKKGKAMEMTGRMESVENLSEQRRGFASQRQVSHPSHRPLEIADAITTFPQPRRRRLCLSNLQTTNQGNISIALPRGTFLSPLDSRQYSLTAGADFVRFSEYFGGWLANPISERLNLQSCSVGFRQPKRQRVERRFRNDHLGARLRR